MKYFILKYEVYVLTFIVGVLGVITSTYLFATNNLLLYGDAESHLNIAKRIVDSLTPGFAQLGGIWLPLPHLLLLPFVIFDPLWRSGLAGSIVGGISYIIAAIFVFKIIFLITKNRIASYAGFFVFATNPNILYLQSTALGELTLIAFFVLSVYYFLKYLHNCSSLPPLILSAFFGFCATLSRYDGWFLVLFESFCLITFFVIKRKKYSQMEGILILFSTLAFFGIFLWFLWDGLILHDPFYFTNSPFSAKSQQKGWLERGQLVTYKNLPLSTIYYSDATARNIGFIITGLDLTGLLLFVFTKNYPHKIYTILLLGFPFIFYIITLYLGQSIILLPDVTPKNFTWHLFNARYGVIMIPFSAFFIGVLFTKKNYLFNIFLLIMIGIQLFSFYNGTESVITYEDGKNGLSAMKQPDAQVWMAHHYDKGLVLLDDYARTISIIKSNIPLQNVIYVGNHPYWEKALKDPQQHVTWVVLQKNDTVWNYLFLTKTQQNNLYKYYQKVYTSPTVIIFKRNTIPA